MAGDFKEDRHMKQKHRDSETMAAGVGGETNVRDSILNVTRKEGFDCPCHNHYFIGSRQIIEGQDRLEEKLCLFLTLHKESVI